MTQERICEVLEGRIRESENQTDVSGIGMDNVINRLELFLDKKICCRYTVTDRIWGQRYALGFRQEQILKNGRAVPWKEKG